MNVDDDIVPGKVSLSFPHSSVWWTNLSEQTSPVFVGCQFVDVAAVFTPRT